VLALIVILGIAGAAFVVLKKDDDTGPRSAARSCSSRSARSAPTAFTDDLDVEHWAARSATP
jgi:hypothetical protein